MFVDVSSCKSMQQRRVLSKHRSVFNAQFSLRQTTILHLSYITYSISGLLQYAFLSSAHTLTDVPVYIQMSTYMHLESTENEQTTAI